MGIVFYTLFIWPIRIFVEAAFVFFQVLFNYRAGLSIVLLSLGVNTVLLPIYAAVDRWQQQDRELRQRMKKKIEDIKAVFKGEERRFILNTYYRQMGYSPLNSLKASLGVLLQIPFFLAAYQFLSHTTSLQGQSFLFLKDLSKPDALLTIGGISVHLMPLLMTGFNVASALLYSREMERKERVQLLVMAAIFLVLLYDSPSGLVLYWTVNNLFSLSKNVATRYFNRPGRILYVVTSFTVLLSILSILLGVVALKSVYKYLALSLGMIVICVPLGKKCFLVKVRGSQISILSELNDKFLYLYSCLVFCVLLGFLVPSQIIASSPTEFNEPWKALFCTVLQGISICILLPGFIWFLIGEQRRKYLALFMSCFALVSVVCYFFLSGSYGTLTRGFQFDNPHLLKSSYPIWVDIITIVSVAASLLLLLRQKKERFILLLLKGIGLALIILGLVSFFSIMNSSFLAKTHAEERNWETDKVFTFSRKSNNTFILFLDQACGVAFYYAIDMLPETIKEMEGFVWYPKTISFGDCTILGVPPLLGGYDYTPWNVNARLDTPLVRKVNEALTLLPKLFGESGWRVSITDPSLANLQWIPDTTIYDGMRNVKARNIKGLFSKRFLQEKGYPPEKETEAFDFDILFRYGVLRIALPILRYLIYYNGNWWRDGRSNSFDRSLAVFPNLYYLSDLCHTDDESESISIFMNESTHEYGAFTAELLPSRDPIRYSEKEVARFGSQNATGYMYVFLASIKAVGRWLNYLKQCGVYDNTKIIIVSDHG